MKLIFNIGYALEDSVYERVVMRSNFFLSNEEAKRNLSAWNILYDECKKEENYKNLLEKLKLKQVSDEERYWFRHKKL